ncbi:MAG: RNA methyltransferase [Saprospiraceae bacterium]
MKFLKIASTMNVSNNIKLVKDLHDKKNRYKESLYLAEGSRLVLDLINHHPEDIHGLYATFAWLESNQAKVVNFLHMVVELEERKLNSIASLKSTKEVLAIVKMPQKLESISYSSQNPAFYLDQVQDPGNFGTIIRTADWFGITHIFHSHHCADPFNNKAVQASMSSIARVKLMECSPTELSSKYMFQNIIGTKMNGTSIQTFQVQDSSIICLGNEAHGISPELSHLCQEFVSIPSSSLGSESLNVGITAGILMSRFYM